MNEDDKPQSSVADANSGSVDDTSLSSESIEPTTEPSYPEVQLPTAAPVPQAPTTTSESSEPEPTAAVTTTANVTPPVKPLKKNRSKWLLPAIVVAILVVLGGGAYAYFGVYMQSPQQIWDQALKNTADGYKKFAATKPTVKKGAKITGTFKITQPLAADGSITLNSDDKNFKFLADAGASGARATLELRGVQSAGTTPDLYIKLGGVKGIGGILGATSSSQIGSLLSGIDEKWFAVDHTLLDQMATADKSGQSKAITSESPEQLQNDAYDINKKVSDVINDRLLTTDNKKAVVIVKDNLGKDTFKGRAAQHYRVKVQKQQLRDMAVALKDALKDTKLKELLGAGDNTKTFEQAINFDNLLKQIDNANYDKAQAEVWVDSGLKYIRDVRINAIDAQGNNTGSIDFFLDYTGGDDLPFQVNITSTEKNNTGSINLGVTFNQKTNVTKLSSAIDFTTGSQKVAGKADVSVEGSDDKVSVEKPVGAQNLLDLVAPLLAKFQSGSR